MHDDDNNPSNNPFIRFKHHVDTNIHAGLNTLTNLSRSPADTPSPDTNSNNNNNTNRGTTTTSPTSTMDPTNPDAKTAMTMLTPSEQHIESRLSLLSHGGSTAPEANLAWRLFLTRSAYSPLRLQAECDWQPVPRDLSPSSSSSSSYSLPSSSSASSSGWGVSSSNREYAHGYGYSNGTGNEHGYDGAGWLDAFEDLMRVSSGLELADLRSRASEERGQLGSSWGWGGGFGFGFPNPHHHHGTVGIAFPAVREMAFLDRMRRQGLTEVLFPVYDPGVGYASPRTMGEWVARRRAEEQRAREVRRVWEELVGESRRAVEEAEREADKLAEEVRREFGREVDKWRDETQEKGSSFFDGIGGLVKTLSKVIEDEVQALEQFGKPDQKSRRKDDTAAEKKETAPETEGDLYSFIQSAFHESERSLSNFFKSFSEAWRLDNPHKPKPASPPKTETTEVIEDGITKKTTKEEFVDKHGNTHCKTETTWTDQDGRVVMRQVHSSMGRSEHWEKTESRPTEQVEKSVEEKVEEHKEHRKEQRKEGGWFWK